MTGPGGKSSRRPSPRSVSDDEVAILAAPWPLLPNGEYTGTAIRVETGFLPGASRKPRVGQAERRQEWRLFMHVRLEQAASSDGHAALERHRQEHSELPVTYYVCRFEKARGRQPVRPHPSSKLYRPVLGHGRPGVTAGPDEFLSCGVAVMHGLFRCPTCQVAVAFVLDIRPPEDPMAAPRLSRQA